MSSCVISVLCMWPINLVHRQADSLFRKVHSARETRKVTDSRRVVHYRRCSRLGSWSGGQMKKRLSPCLRHAVCLIWEEVSKKQKQKTNCLRPVLWEIWKERGQIWTDTCPWKISFHSLIKRNCRVLDTATVAFTKLGVLSNPFTLRGPVFRRESWQEPRRVTF